MEVPTRIEWLGRRRGDRSEGKVGREQKMKRGGGERRKENRIEQKNRRV